MICVFEKNLSACIGRGGTIGRKAGWGVSVYHTRGADVAKVLMEGEHGRSEAHQEERRHLLRE